MTNKRILTKVLLTFLILISHGAYCNLFGQQHKAIVKFAETEHNFGTFRESDGVVSHTFTFVNDGDLPLIINSVACTGGCASPLWTHEPVVPGQEGMIQVYYDPKDRPGAFTRSVVVNTNAETPVVKLVIRGVVIPVDLIGKDYQYSIGDLKLETTYAAFGQLYKGDTGRISVSIYNSSESRPLQVGFPDLPGHIRITPDPEVLEPLQEGLLNIDYMTGKLDDWDFVVDRLVVKLNNEMIPGGFFSITANVREDFSGLTTDELLKAPQVKFNSTVFNFGIINQERPVSYDFILTNTGKNDLNIRKISASCGCTAVQPETKTVQPGDSTRITAVFNPKGQAGNQKKAITVITNDPKHYKTILWIEGAVQTIADKTE